MYNKTVAVSMHAQNVGMTAHSKIAMVVSMRVQCSMHIHMWHAGEAVRAVLSISAILG